MWHNLSNIWHLVPNKCQQKCKPLWRGLPLDKYEYYLFSLEGWRGFCLFLLTHLHENFCLGLVEGLSHALWSLLFSISYLACGWSRGFAVHHFTPSHYINLIYFVYFVYLKNWDNDYTSQHWIQMKKKNLNDLFKVVFIWRTQAWTHCS